MPSDSTCSTSRWKRSSPRNLRPGEDAELESERRRLGNAEALTSLAPAAAGILNQGDGDLPGAIDLVSEAVGRLEKLARIDPDMASAANDGQALLEQLGDLARTLQDYAESLEFNPERLAEVEERLELIAGSEAQVRRHHRANRRLRRDDAQAELDELNNWEVKTADLEQQEEKLLREIGKIGTELSERRSRAGEDLARQVEAELADLQDDARSLWRGRRAGGARPTAPGWPMAVAWPLTRPASTTWNF